MAHNYILQVTAGSEYDPETHQIVPVNAPTPVSIESDLIHADLNVRIQDYKGLPLNSPRTSPYFNIPTHAKNRDAYSISFQFRLKQDINANDLVFGNDFDHPIRDRLPPGFGTAFKIVKWVVDPGLDGDVYADEPYLYGPAASSVNTLYIGPKNDGEKGKFEEESAAVVFQEGGSKEGLDLRRENGIPETEAARKKHFLNEGNRKNWDWEAGRTYGCDFFNPYLDFNEFALRLPGFTLQIMKHWDGQGLRKERKRSHTLRYVLKDRKTNKLLFVVLFTLYLKEDVDENGNVKRGVEGGIPFDQMDKATAAKHHRKLAGTDAEGEAEGDDEAGQSHAAERKTEEFYSVDDGVD